MFFLPKASIHEGTDGVKFVTGASGEMPKPDSGAGAPAEATEAKKEGGKDDKTPEGNATAEGGADGDAADGNAHAPGKGDDEPPAGGKGKGPLTIFQDPPEVITETVTPKALEQVQVLRHLTEGRSPNFSVLRFIIIVPLPKPKAKEVLKDGLLVGDGDVEKLQKQVEKLSKAGCDLMQAFLDVCCHADNNDRTGSSVNLAPPSNAWKPSFKQCLAFIVSVGDYVGCDMLRRSDDSCSTGEGCIIGQYMHTREDLGSGRARQRQP